MKRSSPKRKPTPPPPMRETFVVEPSDDGQRWYMTHFNHVHMTKAIWSIHTEKVDAEKDRDLAYAGQHPLQLEGALPVTFVFHAQPTSRLREAMMLKTDDERLAWFDSLTPEEQAAVITDAKQFMDVVTKNFLPIMQTINSIFESIMPVVTDISDKLAQAFPPLFLPPAPPKKKATRKVEKK